MNRESFCWKTTEALNIVSFYQGPLHQKPLIHKKKPQNDSLFKLIPTPKYFEIISCIFQTLNL